MSSSKIVIFGGGGICNKGIIPVVGGTAITHDECDVQYDGEITDALKKHRPEVVIVTAGVSHPQKIDKIPPDGNKVLWADEIEVNLMGSIQTSSRSVQYGVKTIILMGSVAGKYGKPNHAGYCASKAGVISLVQSLAQEGHNAYCISPGRVDTPMRQRDYPQDTPGSRLDPKEIGYVVKDILDGKYTPGDNIIIRRIGLETAPIKVDKGEPWKTELRVGEPVTI